MANILIVEDDHINFELASELLKYAGHDIQRAENLQQCLDSVNCKKPDLVLMDIDLPEIKGTEITRVLKNNPGTKAIPVVAFTAMVMENDKKEAFEAGCSGFISKPFSVSTFASTVESFIDKNKPDRETTKLKKDFIIENFEHTEEHGLIDMKIKHHNILVVDDNEMNADILKETLEQLGQDVKLAYSGKQAFDIMEQEKFDLVLLDIMMPDMSGFDIIKQFKLNHKTVDLPVIFVSAMDKTSDIVKGFNLGSYEYIVKPYKIEELKARVLSILKIKDLQDELKAEKKILDLIFQFSEDVIILLDSDFKILSCNEMFFKWTEGKKEGVLNKKFCEIISCKYEECLLSSCDTFSYFDFEIEINNQKRFIEANCSKISMSGENTEGGYIMVMRDITAKREIEAQKETFVATLTHDLKTPVRAQIKALEMLLNGKFGQINESQTEILNETLNSNKYMACMLDNLLTTYKYDNGKVAMNKQYVDINSLIRSCCCELKHLAEDKKQKVIFNFEQEPVIAFVDSLEIKRVFINLLSNAFTYTEENGEISIVTKIENKNTVISFTDTGRGMSEEELSNLFNKFTSYSKKFRQVGTGLGLYLSKKIIESHNGTISVDSKEGKGSCFTVFLPSM